MYCAGDVALGGRKLSEEEGHFNDNRKPSGFDTKQIFVSPSVRYSGHNCYAKPKRQLETLHVPSLAYVHKANGRIFDWLKNLPPHFFRTRPLIIFAPSFKGILIDDVRKIRRADEGTRRTRNCFLLRVFFFGIRNKLLRSAAQGLLVVTPRLLNFGLYHIKFDLEFNVQIFERPCI